MDKSVITVGFIVLLVTDKQAKAKYSWFEHNQPN